MAGRKIRDREDAQACLKAARAARGQSQAQWARQQGIDGAVARGVAQELSAPRQRRLG
jgi:hypothetical protein